MPLRVDPRVAAFVPLPNLDWNDPRVRHAIETLGQFGMQADALVRGAADALTFGTADKLAAGMNTATGLGGPGASYASNLKREQARDQYDRTHRALARGAGEVLGTGMQVLEGGLLPAGPKLAGRALPRGIRASAAGAGRTPFAVGGGAAAGLAGQKIADLATGRHSSPAQYAASAWGGGVGGLGQRFGGPLAGGALAGGATGLAQSFATGAPIDTESILHGIGGGALLGRVGEMAGAQGANALPRNLKGKLGEAMSIGKSVLDGEGVAGLQQRHDLAGGGYTIADHVNALGKLVEAKFGPYAKLTPAQIRAALQLGGFYRIDRWMPSDVGRFTGGVSGQTGAANVDGSTIAYDDSW